MGNKEIIIIGAGLGGLSAACYSAMNGYKTTLLERRRVVGGLVASWKRKDYVIDGGVHFWSGYRPAAAGNNLYQELGVSKACRFSDLKLYCRLVDQLDQGKIDITDDITKFKSDLRDISPSDYKMIQPIIRLGESLMDPDLMERPFRKPLEICDLLEKVKLAWEMRPALSALFPKYRQSVHDYTEPIRDQWLRFVIRNIFSPDVSVQFLAWILAGLFSKQLGLLDGCSTSVTSAIQTRLEELDVQIIFNARVAKISVANDRAVGVIRENNARHDADAVICACDAYTTIYELLGGRYTNGDIDRRFKEWKPVKPMVMVNLGVDRTLDDEPWLQIIRLKNPVIVGETRVKALTMRTFNYSDRFAPLGKTVVQVSFESEWEFWREIGRDSRTYQHEKSRIAEEISDRLEEIFPGFYGQIEMTDVVTPITTWRHTRNYKAAYMGWVPTWEVMSAPALRTAPGLDSLYIAGQWSMGGGALPCLYSGRQVIQLICHKDGKPFISSRP